MFFSIIGWLIEFIFRSIKKKRLINPGFMLGITLPIYGFGGVVLYVLWSITITNIIWIDIILISVISLIILSTIEYIGGYIAALNGIDALVFTAGLGENASHIRRMVIDRLACLGFECDREKNDETRLGKEGIISTPNSKIPVYVIGTNEELMMARDAYNLSK
jgi:hypothetical protein